MKRAENNMKKASEEAFRESDLHLRAAEAF